MDFFPTSISFPKYVEINNSRLTKVYLCTLFVMVIVPVVDFYLRDGYLVQTESLPSAHSVWVTNWNPDDEQARVINEADAKKDYCTNSEMFEYCDTEDCAWSAKDMTCADFCTSETFVDCIASTERWFKDPAGSIFLPTFFTDYTTEFVEGSGESAGKIVDRIQAKKARIIKGVEEMSISFNHGYRVEKFNPSQDEDPLERGTNHHVDPKYEQGLRTILRTAENDEIAKFDPGQTVTLPVRLLLERSGIQLDRISPEYGPNLLKDAQITDGILARLAGAVISIEVTYENPLRHRRQDWNGPVSYLTISSDSDWTSRPTLHVFDKHGSQRMRYYQGLQINFFQSGTFSWMNWSSLIQCVTSIIVFVGTAKTIVAQFAFRCLGGLSVIYKNFCYHRAHLDKECYSMAARMASYTSTFLELEDVDHPEPGISRKRLLHRFKRAFAGAKDLSDIEIKRFTHFIFDGMNKGQSRDMAEGYARKRDGTGTDVEKDQPVDVLDVEEWLYNIGQSEPLSYDSLVGMFDSDRKKGFLEQLFAPGIIRAIMETDDMVRDKKT